MLLVNKDQSYHLEKKNALYLANACHLEVIIQGQFVKTQRLQKHFVQRKKVMITYAEGFQMWDVKSK